MYPKARDHGLNIAGQARASQQSGPFAASTSSFAFPSLYPFITRAQASSVVRRRAKLSVHLFSFCRFLSLCDFKDNDRRNNRENDPNRKGIPENHQPDLIGSFFAARSFASCASTSSPPLCCRRTDHA